MRIFLALLVLVCGASVISPAAAEVAAASPSAFLIQAQASVPASPAHSWRALTRVGGWWSSAHTFSGDARRLSLDPRAGGCWCERWNGQSVEHARVVMVSAHEGVRTLRVVGGLGPLQELGVTGVLTFTIAPDPAGAKIALSYRVSGDAGLGLDAVAPFVDQVLMEQFGRLVRYAGGGSPD
jgi:hypothetical protein